MNPCVETSSRTPKSTPSSASSTNSPPASTSKNAKTQRLPWWNTRKATPPAGSSNSANASTTTSTPTAPHHRTERENEKPRRELNLHTGRDGRLNFSGSFDGETGTLFSEILSPLAKPRPAEDGRPDQRSVSQRNGDALADALNLIADSGKLPIQGQERPHLTITITITITMDWELLRERLGVAYAHTGTAISPESGRRLACEADIIPMILGRNSVPLNVGRTERLIPIQLRKALIARDKGCAKCGRPPRWCRAATTWSTGPTVAIHA
nr:DUF222 domain-containing protein [Fodinicola feengrottensis]